MEMFHSYWLISDPLKILFESIDPDAFAFQRCDVKLGDGSTGPVHWLCDVVRVLDDRALDESTLQEMRNFPWRLLSSIATFDTVVLNGDVVGDAHIFRAPYPSVCVVCDQDLKDACKQARIKGIQFGGKLLIQ